MHNKLFGVVCDTNLFVGIVSVVNPFLGIVYVTFDFFFFLIHDAEKSFFELLT